MAVENQGLFLSWYSWWWHHMLWYIYIWIPERHSMNPHCQTNWKSLDYPCPIVLSANFNSLIFEENLKGHVSNTLLSARSVSLHSYPFYTPTDSLKFKMSLLSGYTAVCHCWQGAYVVCMQVWSWELCRAVILAVRYSRVMAKGHLL